jgi:hypothetical protein
VASGGGGGGGGSGHGERVKEGELVVREIGGGVDESGVWKKMNWE